MARPAQAEWNIEGAERVEALADASGFQTVRVGGRVASQLVLAPPNAPHVLTLGARPAVARYDARVARWTLEIDGVPVPRKGYELDAVRAVSPEMPGRARAAWQVGDDRVEATVDAGIQTVRVGERVASRLPHGLDVVHSFALGGRVVTVRYDVAAQTWALDARRVVRVSPG
jgi:hypothetical protein